MADDPVCLYIARGPVTLDGRDYRSGETFAATEEQAAAALAGGLAERWPPAAELPAEPAAAAKPRRK